VLCGERAIYAFLGRKIVREESPPGTGVAGLSLENYEDRGAEIDLAPRFDGWAAGPYELQMPMAGVLSAMAVSYTEKPQEAAALG